MMKKANIYILVFISLFSIFALTTITASQEKAEETMPTEKPKKKTPTERETKAYDLFNKILDITQTSDIKDVFPQVEALYLEIIGKYPDLALAQESYWRLISLYVNKRTPPEYEKAENLYNEFLKKYPKSLLKSMIDDTLSKNYYKNKKWDKLLNLYLPAVNEYKEKGKLSSPNPMFMYAEAKFNLGDLIEAEKAYKTVIELFPKSSRAATSKLRLEDIKERKSIP